MSLINDVLRNLDQRHASAGERAGLASHVRALPPAQRFRWARLLPVAAGAALGAVALWLYLGPQALTVGPVVAAPAPPPGESPGAGLPPLVVQLPVVEPDEAGAGENSPPVSGNRAAELQLDLRLSTPVPAATPPARAVLAGNPGSVSSAPEADPGAIDKRTRGPHGAEGEFRKAMGLIRQGAAAEAMAGLQAALHLDGRHAPARQALLSLLVEQRRWSDAQALLIEGLGLDPAQAGWAMALARIQVEQGQLAEAEATLSRHGHPADPGADYQAFHALVLQKLHRPQEAAERFRGAVTIRPGEGRWWYGLGAALDQDHRPSEAREAYRKALETGSLPPELSALVEQRLR